VAASLEEIVFVVAVGSTRKCGWDFIYPPKADLVQQAFAADGGAHPNRRG
jgi:hypothetical protein